MPVIYLVRHGTSTVNQRRVRSDERDPPLTEQGITQAHRIGSLMGRKWNHREVIIVTSSSDRTRHTAHLIGSYLPRRRIEEVDWLTEGGDDETVRTGGAWLAERMTPVVIVVVGHSRWLSRLIHYWLTGMLSDQYRYRLDNGSITKLGYYEEQWMCHYLNRVPGSVMI